MVNLRQVNANVRATSARAESAIYRRTGLLDGSHCVAGASAPDLIAGPAPVRSPALRRADDICAEQTAGELAAGKGVLVPPPRSQYGIDLAGGGRDDEVRR